ncbi:hypothetical protein AAFF_G00152670 [Aldrovandia affinis]|uniref:CRIB domain-containing protein n=1 Tax=Aldrovandia affinis TaxID=143900 RepID=A0AAD7RNK5_9TELE|nr:hypothetical protein AAFF_G00152670 [Aldrovandia affinis]
MSLGKLPGIKGLMSNSQGKRRFKSDLSVDMISPPLGDFRHTMHVGAAGTCSATPPSSATTAGRAAERRTRSPPLGAPRPPSSSPAPCAMCARPRSAPGAAPGTSLRHRRPSPPSSRMPSPCHSWTGTVPTATCRGCSSPLHPAAQRVPRTPMVCSQALSPCLASPVQTASCKTVPEPTPLSFGASRSRITVATP